MIPTYNVRPRARIKRYLYFGIFSFFFLSTNAYIAYVKKANLCKATARFYAVRVATNKAHHLIFIHWINLKHLISSVIGNRGAADLREDVQP